jgi:uncharacterized protein (DUF1330 family)
MNEEMNVPAYMVFTRLHTRNPAELAIYGKEAPNFFAGVPVKFLAKFGPCEVVEGGGVEGVAILEFPSVAEAKAWYNGMVYQEARKHRFLGGDYSVVIVEGSDPARAR